MSEERDTLLLESIMAVVPNPGGMKYIIEFFADKDAEPLIPILKGYGTLLNIIQSAIELDGPMEERLSAAYYELTNEGGE